MEQPGDERGAEDAETAEEDVETPDEHEAEADAPPLLPGQWL